MLHTNIRRYGAGNNRVASGIVLEDDGSSRTALEILGSNPKYFYSGNTLGLWGRLIYICKFFCTCFLLKYHIHTVYIIIHLNLLIICFTKQI